MTAIYKNILEARANNQKLFAVLLDPDKIVITKVSSFLEKVNNSIATHIFVGGSKVDANKTDLLVNEIKRHTKLPIVLFPGDVTQISNKADAILFLSLISGRNTDYLIGKHIESVPKLVRTNLEVIPTGYILIENGKQTAVEKVTGTAPISRLHVNEIVYTAKAGEFLGLKLIYLEAGSGALKPVTSEIIEAVRNYIDIPLIVGGGIKDNIQLENAYRAGADVVVVGTAFEQDESLIEQFKKQFA
jgi:putative glycerol-1-phosphate prenyltransferase